MMNLRTISEYLQNWEWEKHITLSFQDRPPLKIAELQVRTFLNNIQKHYTKMRIAGQILITQTAGATHSHILLTSLQNYPTTLGDLSVLDITKHWHRNKATTQITVTSDQQWDQTTVTRYWGKLKNINPLRPSRWILSEYKTGVLKKLQTRQLKQLQEG